MAAKFVGGAAIGIAAVAWAVKTFPQLKQFIPIQTA